MAAPVVSPVRGCGPDSGERGPSAGKLMSLSHSLAADVLSRTSSNMLNNATDLSASTARSTCSKASTNPHPGSTDECGDSSGPERQWSGWSALPEVGPLRIASQNRCHTLHGFGTEPVQ